MNRDNLNISKIETYLNSIIDNNVSPNTYAGTLPDTIKSDWTDMVLIDCGHAIRDLDAYGQGTVLVWLYVKRRGDGAKNTAIMSQLERKLDEVIKHASSSTYQISRRNTYSEYDTNRKWHCNIVELNIIIL
jgi:hypothetical protein